MALTIKGSVSGVGVRVACVVGLAVVCAGVASAQPAPGMYATDNAGNFFRIDLATGAPTVISAGRLCSAAGSSVTELEYNNDTGAGIVQDSNGAFSFNTLDFVTGLPSGPTIGNGGAFNGMEWVHGVLYGTVVLSGGGSNPSELWTLDPATGATSVVGPTGLNNISGLAYDKWSGVLYGVTAGGVLSDLVTIDLATGTATVVGNTQIVLGSLEFSSAGRLYGGGGQGNANELWEIDPATGGATLIGNTGLGANAITGLALVESKVFYGINNAGGGFTMDELVVFAFSDPADFIVIGPIVNGAGAQLSGLGGLDFNGDGSVLYASDSFGGNPGDIYVIDPGTGQATLLGNCGAGQVNDLAWSPIARDLFGVDTDGRLWANLDDPANAVNLGPFSVPGMVNIGLGFDGWGTAYVHDLVTDTIYVSTPGSLTTLVPLHILPFDTNFTQGLFVDWSRDDQGYHAAYNSSIGDAENYLFGTLVTGGGYGPLVGSPPADLRVADLTCPPVPQCGFVNPSFETGDFTGWIVRDLTNPFYAITVDPSTGLNLGFGFSWFSAATDGQFTVFHGFDGNGATSGYPITLGQDVLVTESLLTFDWRGAWDLELIPATLDRTMDVVVRAEGGGAELARIPILIARAGVYIADTGQRTSHVDLSAFKGQRVRVSFEWLVPENSSGPAQFQFDNVCLSRACEADINGDDQTDVFDFGIFVLAFGTEAGDPGFVPEADFDHNLRIDVFDFGVLALDFGCGTGP